jgi:predicted DNA-binding transcriptional regulator YafY
MRRADRLFQIVQHLRGRRLTTAAQLSDWLETSTRTIYRDIRDLSLSGVPIEGEPGVGYRLSKGFDIPPIMFDFDEIQALATGLRFVQSWAGPQLSAAAKRAQLKIQNVVPSHRSAELQNTPLHFPSIAVSPAAPIDQLRTAIEERQILLCQYCDAKDNSTSRRLRPLGIYFWGGVWTLLAWCESRNDFRSFRLDRFQSIQPTAEKFQQQAGQTLEDFLKRWS